MTVRKIIFTSQYLPYAEFLPDHAVYAVDYRNLMKCMIEMKYIFNMIIFVLLMNSGLKAQVVNSSDLSVSGITFRSESTWNHSETDRNDVLGLVNMNRNLQLKLWFQDFEGTAKQCLVGIMDREGCSMLKSPFTTRVDNREATAVIAGKTSGHRPVKLLILAIQQGNGYYVATFECPEDSFRDHLQMMNRLISSISLDDPLQSQVYYADQKTSS